MFSVCVWENDACKWLFFVVVETRFRAKMSIVSIIFVDICVSNHHLINIKNLLKLFTPNGREYEKHTLKMEYSISRVFMLCTFYI